MNSVPVREPTTRATRFAVCAGTLTAPRIQVRRAEAEQRGLRLLEVFTEAELLHLRLIQKALMEDATWEDAVVEIERHG